MLPGLLACVIVAAAARLVGTALQLGLETAVALGIGLAVGSVAPGRAVLLAGAGPAARYALRIGITLLGARLTVGQLIATGGASVIAIAAVVTVALLLGTAIARRLGLRPPLSALITVGMAICGNSAILALAPIVRAPHRETAYAISTITLFGLVGVLLLPVVGRALGLADGVFGTWAGLSVNDTAQVVATGYAFSPPAGDTATVVKLTRNLAILPVLIGATWLAVRAAAAEAAGASSVAGEPGAPGPAAAGSPLRLVARAVPWFVIGFVIFAGLRSAGLLDGVMPTGGTLADLCSTAASLLILVALAGVGISTDVRAMLGVGARPFLLGASIWVVLVGLGLVLATVVAGGVGPGSAGSTMPDSAMDLEIILTPGLGNATYLLAADGEAVVIDPPRDAWRVTSVADARGWRLTHVVETHVHNDYLSGALELRADRRASIVAPARGRYVFEHRGVDEGDTVVIGGLRLVARATPGHTPEHLAWEVTADGADGPSAVLTGGSLLVGSAGRTDLLGADATDGLTRAQFDSLRALARLPDDVAVLPTHGPGSFCTAGPIGGGRTSTIGQERRTNPLLAAADEAAFRRTLLDRLGAYPTYYADMAPINRAGPLVVGRPPTPPMLDAGAFRAAVAAGAHIVDGRPRAEFAAGHVPGSLNIELDDSFASYVGWFVPFGAAVALVLPEPAGGALEEATIQLFRIGYDRIVGALRGGMAGWTSSGGDVRTYPTTTIEALHADALAGANAYALDVREPHEWRDEGVVPGAIQIPLGDLADRLATVPRDAPVTVMCRSGARASIAASVLDAAGIEVRLVARGGAPDWPASNAPTAEARRG